MFYTDNIGKQLIILTGCGTGVNIHSVYFSISRESSEWDESIWATDCSRDRCPWRDKDTRCTASQGKSVWYRCTRSVQRCETEFACK